MPTREQIVADVIHILEHGTYPGELSRKTAWLGIYRALLWYEPVGVHGFEALPHIIDADKLRPSAWRTGETRAGAWQRRAKKLEEYVATALACPPEDVRGQLDQLMRLPDYHGHQRQNPLGIAFAGATRHVLERFGNEVLSYNLEVDATLMFPGISMPWRSDKPRIDILVLKGGSFPAGNPVAIISTKWSIRHDRINDLKGECPEYKAAAIKRNMQIKYYAVTNEFDPARLNRLVTDGCIDGIVHVHKYAVTDVCGLNGRLHEMLDLADLVELTRSW